MTLVRNDDLGTIRLNDMIFSKILLNCLNNYEGKVFFATEKGKLIAGTNQSVTPGKLVPHIEISESDELFKLSFYIILTFGASIQQTSSNLLNDIEEALSLAFPNKRGRITLKIVGMKSKKIIERNIEIVREYESKR